MSSSNNPRKRAGRPRSPRRRPRARNGLALTLLPGPFAVCRLEPDAEVPRWALGGRFSSISKSPDELSIVCEEEAVPRKLECQRGWRALRVAGPLDMELIGVLASIALPLAKAKISLFAVSTYDTDYVLVRDDNLDRTLEALRGFGHRIEDAPKPKAERRKREDVPSAEEAEEPEEIEAPKRRPPRRMPRASSKKARKEKQPARYGPLPGAPEVQEASEPEKSEPAARQTAPREKPPRDSAPQDEKPRDEKPRDEKPRDEKPRDEKPRVEKPRDEKPRNEKPRNEKPRRARPDDVTSDGLFTGAIPQHPVETTDLPFTALGLSDAILETVSELGFEHPTPIQAGVIPEALEGRDVIGLAETGSGKTAAFSLPLAERLTHGRGIRGLILCPTREIALQTMAFLDIFGRNHHLTTVVVIGGVRMSPQIRGLKDQPDIIVATPGRLADHMRRRNVRLDAIEHLVLDEADHMLDLGFLPQIREILEQVPEKRQTMMFSATMPPPIERLTQQFMRDPVRVDFRPVGHAAAGIAHRLYLVHDEEDRKRCLYGLLREVEGSTLVFVRRKLHTEWLARQLELAGFPVERIHSDRSQGQRVSALRGFREGQHEVLVATDVAARGIDVPGIRHVINFGLPDAVEDYVHRAGRTARGAAKGIVSSIGTWQDKETVSEIERALGLKLPRCEVDGVEPYVELKPRRTVRRRRLL